MISVIIPCYNPPLSVFRKTLISLKNSTLKDFYLIIVDDGSTNRLFLDILPESFPNAKIIKHELNRGLSAARNTGVANCETPLFLQIDADDLIAPTFLEKARDALILHPKWGFCNAWSKGIGAKNYLWSKGFECGSEFFWDNQVPATAVIRREADRAIGGHDESIHNGNEDWDYWLRMAANGIWGGTLSECLIFYRHHHTPTFWPDRDDPVRKARFKLKMWWRYKNLLLKKSWDDINMGQDKTYVLSNKAQKKTTLTIKIAKVFFTLSLALGLRSLTSVREYFSSTNARTTKKTEI